MQIAKIISIPIATGTPSFLTFLSEMCNAIYEIMFKRDGLVLVRR